MSIPDPITMALCSGGMGLQTIRLSEETMAALFGGDSQTVMLNAEEAAAFEEAAEDSMPVIVEFLVGKSVFNCIDGCYSQFLAFVGDSMEAVIMAFTKLNGEWACCFWGSEI